MEYPNMVIIGLQVCPTTPTEGGLPRVYGQTELHSVYQAGLNFMARLCPKSKVIMKYFSASKKLGILSFAKTAEPRGHLLCKISGQLLDGVTCTESKILSQKQRV